MPLQFLEELFILIMFRIGAIMFRFGAFGLYWCVMSMH